MLEERSAVPFGNKEKVFAVRVSCKSLDPNQGNDIGFFVSVMFLVFVHYFGRASIKTSVRNRAVNDKCPEFVIDAPQEALYLSARCVFGTTGNDSPDTD